VKLARIVVHDFGIAAEHNYPCGVCGQEKAILFMRTGVFGPCWKCQAAGWRTVKLPIWLMRFARWMEWIR
jgi:hypothetical protein